LSYKRRQPGEYGQVLTIRISNKLKKELEEEALIREVSISNIARERLNNK